MRFVREHHEAIEYDFLQVGVDLLDVYRGTLTWRRIAVLLAGLPQSSMTVGKRLEWRENQWVMRDIFDALASANWQRGNDPNATRPTPYPRPGETNGNTDERTLTRARAWRERQHQREIEEATPHE